MACPRKMKNAMFCFTLLQLCCCILSLNKSIHRTGFGPQNPFELVLRLQSLIKLHQLVIWLLKPHILLYMEPMKQK